MGDTQGQSHLRKGLRVSTKEDTWSLVEFYSVFSRGLPSLYRPYSSPQQLWCKTEVENGHLIRD